MNAGLRILEAGWLTTLQDLGRSGVEELGIPISGAADQYSASAANLLVGNERAATCLEIMGTRFSAVAETDLLISITGATAEIHLDGLAVSMWQPVCIRAGSVVTVTGVRDGIRLYLAINGAIETERFLGSAAPDARMGFPQRIHTADIVRVRTRYMDLFHPYSDIPLFDPHVVVPELGRRTWTIDVTDGPEIDAAPGMKDLIETSVYTVGPNSDHVGLRLDGPVLHPVGLPEITSHGIPIGAIEIPHSDELIILGRARSLTAGYPIAAIATKVSQSRLGQAGPGRRLRIRWVTMDFAVQSYRAQERDLTELEATMASLFASIGVPAGVGTFA
ncbi:biotin-dependent carboxyltransferase family protein [Rhodococcoides yunnanense]|uniref:5-oxoprolinase subunit C family protein n=1 Tax=Rhodococcoides yunnanense TaxID=278209 RepID=UPI0009346570|nr:biotin-dependent carboxyltransferase family protein [Rhodococcus yunnanensis]